MMQKRLLTLLPLFFLAGAIAFVLFLVALNESDEIAFVNIDCLETFSDKGIGLEFDYSCEWIMSQNTLIDESDAGYELEQYLVQFTDEEESFILSLELQLDNEIEIIELDGTFPFEIVEGDLVRYSLDEGIYYYSEQFSCNENSDTQCISTWLSTFDMPLPLHVELVSSNENVTSLTDMIIYEMISKR